MLSCLSAQAHAMWRLMHDPKSCSRDDVFMIFFHEAGFKSKFPHGVFDSWHSELPDDPQTYSEVRRDMDMPDVAFNGVLDDATDVVVEAVVLSESDESDTDAPSPTEFVAGRLVARGESRSRSTVVTQQLDEDDDDDDGSDLEADDANDDDDYKDDDDDDNDATESDGDDNDEDDDDEDDDEDDDDDNDDDEDDEVGFSQSYEC